MRLDIVVYHQEYLLYIVPKTLFPRSSLHALGFVPLTVAPAPHTPLLLHVRSSPVCFLESHPPVSPIYPGCTPYPTPLYSSRVLMALRREAAVKVRIKRSVEKSVFSFIASLIDRRLPKTSCRNSISVNPNRTYI